MQRPAPGRKAGRRASESAPASGGTPGEAELGSVIAHVTGAFPPAFVVTAQQDFLKYQTAPFAGALMDIDMPVALRCFADPKTPLLHVFHLDVKNLHARACTDAECAFFRELC